jgi:hypothetical protein
MQGTAVTSGLRTFQAILTGANEVPPVATPGVGVSRLTWSPDQAALSVVLGVAGMRDVTAAHIHMGQPGQNGPIVLFLYGPAAPRSFLTPSLLTNRTFSAADLTGPLQGMPLSALFQQMAAGNTYVNVHTVMHPNGEIRGQVVPG